jgi:DNA modification methylase
MLERQPINLRLFEEVTDREMEEAGESLQLNRTLLLDALQKMKQAVTITTLRRELSALKNDVFNSASPIRSDITDDDVVEFTGGHLREDFDQIVSAQTIERAVYYIDRLIKGTTEVKVNSINDLNLNRWKEYNDIYLDSLWIVDRRENSGVHTAGYWGNFIPQIPHQMMKRYTKKGDWVLDTFVGLGTTLIEGQRLGRNTIGNELQEDVAEKARNLVASESNIYNIVTDIVVGDSSNIDYHALLKKHNRSSVQLIMMHPPYFDIIKFSEDPRDLSNASSIDAFLEMIGKVVDNAVSVLDKGRYLALVIGDKYSKGEWIPLGFLTMNEVLRRGFILKSIIVKNFEETTGKRQQKELWKYRALVGGFYIFKHEYIFVFKKQF